MATCRMRPYNAASVWDDHGWEGPPMPYDPDRHHRRSIRLAGFDYGSAGAYFVTICTAGRAPLFGEIRDGEMRMNRIGRLVEDEWMRSSDVRPEIDLGVMALMPNHLHGLVFIRAGTALDRASVGSVEAMPSGPGARRAPFRAPRSLGSMVAGFKAATTRLANEAWENQVEKRPVWQRGYHERIVRDQDELERIEWYIVMNPERWRDDEDYIP